MNKEIQLILNLEDILEYVNSALLYLNGNYNLDKDEIIMYLSTVPEKIEEIKEILIKMEVEKNAENRYY